MEAKELKAQASLPELLKTLGHEPEKQHGQELIYHLSGPKPCFAVNQEHNIWYDHHTGKGGNIIDFAMTYWKERRSKSSTSTLTAASYPNTAGYNAEDDTRKNYRTIVSSIPARPARTQTSKLTCRKSASGKPHKTCYPMFTTTYKTKKTTSRNFMAPGSKTNLATGTSAVPASTAASTTKPSALFREAKPKYPSSRTPSAI